MSVLVEESLPLVALRGVVAMPFVLLSFDIGKAGNIAAIESAVNTDSRILVVCRRDSVAEDQGRPGLFKTGCICRITKIIKLPEGSTRIFIEGVRRARILSLTQELPYMRATFQELVDPAYPADEAKTLRQMISRHFRDFSFGNGKTPIRTVIDAIESITDDNRYVFSAANIVMQSYEDRQAFIEKDDHQARCLNLLAVMSREAEFAKLTHKIEDEVRRQIEKNQREYFLREQIRAIRRELGESEQNDADEFRRRLKAKNVSDELRARISREIDLFSTLPAGSHEMPSLRSYIECMLDLPFTETTEDNLDVANARAVLDRDHYGLEKVKERVLEHLAVARMTGKVNGQILCFVGPPGVGKTSISSSVAEALGRKFVRMSLGGIKDEAEIRGHRRTYIGAMPGRIIAAMRTAGTINPVILFDEIDKLSRDNYQGDPRAAMLEVLDSAQNNSFRDHFLEMPYDLSNVMFITTANSLYDIPEPLRDRMEIIEVPSYLSTEKIQIAVRHLVPKQLEKHGLKKSMLSIPESVISVLIDEYTRESGVRTLERYLATICRKAACDIAEGKKRVRMTVSKLHEYLGTPKYIDNEISASPEVGLVNGLAWTSVGGSVMEIEAEAVKGSGQIQLTGKLGEVMQESAKAAITYIRAHYDKLSIDPDFMKEKDIHIHVPESAVPKDGPSAGTALLTAVVSALTGISVRSKLAMTGEITLRGRVLPIGGLREKLLAALRAGIDTVLIPEGNKKDLEDVPADTIGKLNIVLVKNADQVLDIALTRRPGASGEAKAFPRDVGMIVPGTAGKPPALSA
ncbi:MAG: endopeptidase La [Clostridia bacterium]|nr:endopeptidase La [Clostridia bacterium]